MSLLSKLEYKKGFSDIEKGIANYIIDHKEEVANMRLVELAEATFTSTATISRFCKKLGEKNYNSFKINFASSVLTSYQTDVDYNRPFKENDSIQEVTNQLGELYKDTIEATKALLDYDVLNQVIEKLLKTSVIDIFAVGASYLSGLLFEHRMISIDHFVNFKSSPNDQDKRSLFVNKNTVANETRSPFVTSGIRIGTAAVTTRGFDKEEMKEIAGIINDAIENRNNDLEGLRERVKTLCSKYPLYR